MTETAERLKSELSRLPAQDRAELASFPIDSLDPQQDEDVEAAWQAELERRAEEVRSGAAIGEPAESVSRTQREALVKQIVLHREAREELDEAMLWYERQRTGLGMELLTEVESASRRISAQPEVGSCSGRQSIGFLLVRRFPYVLYYLDLPERIWILAVAHARRRPGYWKSRRPE